MADDLIPTVRSVVINTTDEERLAAFWAELLGVEVAHRTEGFLWLRPQRPGAFSIAFQRVANTTGARFHLQVFGAGRLPSLDSLDFTVTHDSENKQRGAMKSHLGAKFFVIRPTSAP